MSETSKPRPSNSTFGGKFRLPLSSPKKVTVAILFLCLFASFGISKIQMVQDITALLPDKSGVSMSLTELARSSGLMKKVIVLLGPSDLPIEERGLAMDAVVEDLRSLDGIGEVVNKVDEQQVRRAAEVIMSGSAKLRGRAPHRLSEKEIVEKLKRLKQNLSTAEAMVMGQYLLKDPLGFSQNALKGLEAAARSMGAIEGGYLVSKDRRYMLAVAEIDFSPLDVERSKKFVVALDESIGNSLTRVLAHEMEFLHLGGVHFASSSAKAIISDVQVAFTLTVVLVIGVFLFFFRAIRLLPAALFPGGIGMATAAGVMGIAGIPLHALTLGFAATITGISVDYAIHLLKKATFEEEGTTKQRMENALLETARPIVLGCLTTFGAFVLVATSGFTGIRQLALFASISIPVAMLVTLFALPAFHGFLLGGRSSSASTHLFGVVKNAVEGNSDKRRSLVVVAFFAVLLALALVGSLRVSLSGDPRDLRASDSDLEAREKVLKEVFPGLADHALIVATSKSADKALEMNDALYDRLVEKGIEPGHIVSISPFLPSKKTQEASLKSARDLFDGKGATSIKELFASVGFKESYVDNLKDNLDAELLSKETYLGTGLEGILRDSLVKDGNNYHVITRVRAENMAAALDLRKMASSVIGCRLVSERIEIEEALTILQKELVWMLTTWLLAALVVLSIVERSLLFGIRASLPAIFGVAASVALFGFLGRPLTPVASAGVTLVMGLGIDYGIFMQPRRGKSLGQVAFAVTASSLTTIAGFGVLSIAKTRAMADIGLIVLVGVSVAFVTAIWLLPALGRRA